MNWLAFALGFIAFIILAPILGCFLDGLDRIISARMQGRVGPSILQPYYDVRKLLQKDKVSLNGTDGIYITFALVFAIIAGGIFFGGGNLLLCVFVITLASLLLICGAYSTRSPYAEIGAHRETLQVMCYEPMILIMTVVFFYATGSFNVSAVLDAELPIISTGFLTFIGLCYVLTIKLRKSPFDISSSHHAHQELVKGLTTEMSGSTLAKVEIMHWYETVLFFGWVGMFFVTSAWYSVLIAILFAVVIYLLEIFIDNNFARVKWQAMFWSSWGVALFFGGLNLALYYFV